MANLVQLADELEYVPKEQLVQMSQDPNNRFPQFLVLSEIQRRTQNENAYRASQTQPTTTVAEEVVSEFARPMGLQAGMPSESAPTDAFSSESMGMPASAPMQQPMQPPMAMASGGLTSFQTGNKTALNASFANPYNVNETIDVNSIPEEQRNEIVEKSKGLTTAQKVMLGLDAAALGLLVTPAPGARIAAGVTKLLSLGIRGGTAAKRMYDSARTARKLKEGRKVLQRDPSKRFRPALTSGPGTGVNPLLPTIELGRQSLRRELPYKLFAGSTLGGTTYALMDPDSPLSLTETGGDNNETKPELTQAQQDYANLVKQNQLAALQVDDKPKKGLGAFSPTDLIQLGGAIMSARNISELGAGISGMAGMSAQRKADAEEAEILGRLREAQISQLETETALLPDKQLADEIEGVTAAIKQAEEGGADEERIAELRQYLQFLVQQQAMARGYDPQAMSGTNQSLIASYT